MTKTIFEAKNIHEKIQYLKELKSNPLSNVYTIQQIRKELEWVNLNSLLKEEIQILFN